MKKIAIMQPYLFPYIGYFQLINAADEFVIYDDVQWMKGGWINRNRILGAEGPEYITLPIKKDSYKKNIHERFFSDNIDQSKEDILDRIKGSYERAPYFKEAYQLVEQCLDNEERNAAIFIETSLRLCCEYLDINTPMLRSSTITGLKGLRAQERVIRVNQTLDADYYINAIGGMDLYDKITFSSHGIKLQFLKSCVGEYDQGRESFLPNLSIVDVMMFNSPAKIKRMLEDYELV